MDQDSCSYQGNADMYGLGIRLGFYLQWFAKITADIVMRPSEIKGNRFAIYSFTAAVFIALSIQTAKARITDLDGYIVLLLCFGNYYSLVPIFLWRVLTGFKARLDPTRWAAASSSIFLRIFSSVILLAISAYQIAFWASLMSTMRTDSECERVGFLFTQMPLYGRALRIVNITFSSLLIVIGLLGWMDYLLSKQRRRQRCCRATRSSSFLVWLRAIISTLVAAGVISGTELTIVWNGIRDVNALDSLGQLIPFVLGIVVFVRVLWVAFNTAKDDDSQVYLQDGFAPPTQMPPEVYLQHHLAPIAEMRATEPRLTPNMD
ncbi:hypothetical protein V8F33_013556 [Rhypophila sp. PSN 637]